MKLRIRIVIKALMIPLIIGIYGFISLIFVFFMIHVLIGIFNQVIVAIITLCLIIITLFIWYELTKLIRVRTQRNVR